MFTPFEPKLQNRFIVNIDGIPAYTVKAAARPQIEFDEVDEVFLKEQGNRRSACLLSPEDVFKGVKYGN